MPYVFHTLVHQLEAASATRKNTINAVEFADFFEKCALYILDAFEKSNEKMTTLTIIVCMIGVLPIKKKSFSRSCAQSISFANTIMSHVRTNVAQLYSQVQEGAWALFDKGLALLMSIELLQYKSTDFNENKVIFLQEIPDQTRRQAVVNALLCRLIKIDQFVFGDVNWTDLFTMIDPAQIDINQLNLTNSFETLITCIRNISKVTIDYSQFQNHLGHYLDNRISKNSMEGKMMYSSQSIFYSISI